MRESRIPDRGGTCARESPTDRQTFPHSPRPRRVPGGNCPSYSISIHLGPRPPRPHSRNRSLCHPGGAVGGPFRVGGRARSPLRAAYPVLAPFGGPLRSEERRVGTG